MADTNLGTAYVQIMPSAKGMSGMISKELGGEADAAGQSAGEGIVSKIKGVIAAAGIGEVLRQSLMAGGDLQQSFGGLDTLYGDAAEAAKKYAIEASQAGISANEYAEQAVSFGAALKSAYGGDTYKAMEAANTAIMDMADNSAKMGTDIGSIQMAYQGFAKQNYTMLDNLKLGYGGTKTEMERLLKDAQKLSGVEYNIDNLGDVYDAIHVIQNDLGLTGVAAQEASTTFTGSFGAMKAAATNLLASLSLGEGVAPAMKTLLNSVKTFLIGNLLPMVANIITSIPEVIRTAVQTVAPGIMEAINIIPQILNRITAQLPGVLDKGIELITNFANGIFSGAPEAIGSFGDIITRIYDFLLTNGPVILQKGVELIGNLAAGLLQNLPAIVSAIQQVAVNMINTLISHLPEFLDKGIEIITYIAAGISSVITQLPSLLTQIARNSLENFKNIEWRQLGMNVIQFITAGVSALQHTVWMLLKTIGQTALNNFRNIDWRALGVQTITFITGGIKSMFSNIPSVLKSIGNTAGSWFRSIDWLSLGKNIISGIISGLWNGAGNLFSSMQSLAASALETAMSALGIGSPSKVFRDEVGKWIPLGIAAGISAEADSVANAVNGIAQDSVNAFDTSGFGVSGAADGSAPVPGGVVIPITINAPEGMDVVQLANRVSDVLALQMRQTRSAWSVA